MPQFSLTTMIVRPSDVTTSRITDLALGTGALSDVLYSTTRFDGQIDSWDITGTALTHSDSDGFEIGPIAGNNPTLAFVDGQLLSGGGTSGSLTLRALGADGSLGTAETIPDTASFAAPLVAPAVIAHTHGNIGVYAGLSGGTGIVQVLLDSAGNVLDTSETEDRGRTAADDITAMATSTVQGANFVFTASASDLGITAWESRGATGALTGRETLRPETGLWASAPTAIVPIFVDGLDYVVMAAAGSGSLTVISTSAAGELAVVDHVIDDRSTRFEGVTALVSVVYQGQTWLFAGGSDDGITAFQVLDGGRLLARATIADTAQMTLANISALEARADSTGIDIFAASATEAGLTRLRLTIAPDDQVIMDTAGSDTLTGGTGADVFVLGADGMIDTIADFEVGIDRLDLSDWNGLRSTNQIFFTSLSNGIEITYGDETLFLRSADGSSIAKSDLSETDVIAPARIPQDITAGSPGPITTPPDLPERPELPALTPALVDLVGRLEVFGTRDADTLSGSDGNDLIYGMGADDRLSGGAGADLLFGGQGADLLQGGTGDDYLFGGEGRDGGWQNPANPVNPTNDDTLEGGTGDDTLYGQAGRDRLDGGVGDDLLSGGGGRDTFVFRSGQDRVTDFHPMIDRIALDDALWAGTLTAAQIVDRYAQDVGSDTVFDFGADTTLRLEGFDDLSALAGQIDIF